jgi:hypothetical protein
MSFAFDLYTKRSPKCCINWMVERETVVELTSFRCDASEVGRRREGTHTPPQLCQPPRQTPRTAPLSSPARLHAPPHEELSARGGRES